VIVEGRDLAGPTHLRTDTVVVGSGAGGAVVAKILAEAGIDVVVLEEGGYHQARDFTQREDQMMARLFRDRGQQTTEDGLVSVLQGSTYGGSTVINMADCVPIPGEVLAHWRERFGLPELTEDALAPSLARVWERLRVEKIPPAQVNRNNRMALDGAAALGLEADTFFHNRVGCIGSGYCLLGCAYDAKQGCHITYLPDAVAAGATVHCDVRIDRLTRAGEGSGTWTVHGAVVERGPRTARWPISVEARRVVLAAGSVHSPAILWRSGLGRGLPQLGRNVSLQPQLPMYAVLDEAVRAWRGIPQSSFCRSFDDNSSERGLSGFRLEPVFGGLGQLAMALPGFGPEHKAVMADADRIGMALLLVPDRPVGHMTWKWDEARGFRPRIAYSLTDEWRMRLRRGVVESGRLLLAAGARQVGLAHEAQGPVSSADALDELAAAPIESGLARLISAHVQGTCRMGPDPSVSVVDARHRVHGHDGLYVVDASVMPTTASTHTMIPVMTLADRAAHHMLEG